MNSKYLFFVNEKRSSDRRNKHKEGGLISCYKRYLTERLLTKTEVHTSNKEHRFLLAAKSIKNYMKLKLA